MFETVPSSELRIGMYVADLDRPWTETPFLLQGFVIENDEELAQLQRLCNTVVIDRMRSVGDEFRERPREPRERLQRLNARGHQAISEARASAQSFLAASRRISRQAGKLPRLTHTPPKLYDGKSTLEDELVYSAPIVDEVLDAFQHTIRALELEGKADLQQVDALVAELADSVGRNRDALLWLSHLRKTHEDTYDHALNVSVHAMIFARFLCMSDHEVHAMGVAGLLHDVGNIRLNAAILKYPGRLQPQHLAHIQTHVAHGLALLSESEGLDRNVAQIIAQHHERTDGSGYPRGLKNEQIGLCAEAAGLVDSYCAMIAARPYRAAMSAQEALETLHRESDRRFRASLVDQFLQCIGLYPTGCIVELNTGEVAVVIQQNQIRRLQPRVMVLLAADKTLERFPRTLDLLYNPASPTGERYRIVRALPAGSYGIDPAEFFLG